MLPRIMARGKAETTRHERFMQLLDASFMPQQAQRAQSLLCRRFAQIPGAMWEGAGWDEFGANMIRIEDNQVARGLQKIKNDYRANRVEVDYRALDDDGEETADTMDGLYRADRYRSGGQEVEDNAFDEGASGGMGAFRLLNRLEDENDPDNDNQVIDWDIIVDADQSVFWDPNAKRYDKSDAKWCCVITAVARASFNEEWGEDKAVDWPYTVWRPIFTWFQPDVVRIAEWYQVEEQTQKRITLTNRLTGEEKRVWKDAITDDWLKEQRDGGWKQSTRDFKRRRVHKYVLSGAEVLEDCGLIAGPNIPVIPFYGKRAFIDNQEYFQGHTQNAMDLTRVRNTVLSNLVESVGSQPRDIPVVYPEEIVGHAEDWANANKDRLTFLRKNPMFDENGQLIQRALEFLPAPALSEQMGALLQITDQRIADLTNADDGADEVQANVSHAAMDLAATRTDEKSSGYMENWRQTIECCGRVWGGMAEEIYVEEGRKVQTRGADGEEGSATLFEPRMVKGRFLTINDFASGRFNVVADVTESSATKRDKTVRKSLGIAQIAGPDTPIGKGALTTAVLNMDGEGIEDFKKYVRRLGLADGSIEPNEEEKRQQEEAAQNQEPDPTTLVLMGQAKKFLADAGLADAKTETEKANALQKFADALLKFAQREAVDGPVSAPEAPSGLDQVDRLATAELNVAKAEHLREDVQDKRIRRGWELGMGEREHELEERRQEHAEREPANDRKAA